MFKFILETEQGRDVAGNPVYMKIYEVRNIKLGGLKLEKITVAAFDFGDLRKYLGADTPFIIGANAIVHANWILDLKSNKWSAQPL
jgi:hypothetical protein